MVCLMDRWLVACDCWACVIVVFAVVCCVLFVVTIVCFDACVYWSGTRSLSLFSSVRRLLFVVCLLCVCPLCCPCCV